MSEFYPTTTVTFYTTFTPFDDYDIEENFQEEPVPGLIGVPMQILTSDTSQYQPADNRGTTSKRYNARCRGHYPVRLNYLVEDDRTGERYSINEIDQKHNPVGDSSWVIELLKVPQVAGQ